MPVIQRGNRCFNDDKGILMLYDCLSNGHIEEPPIQKHSTAFTHIFNK